MKWLDRLLGRSTPAERAAERKELENLHRWSDRVLGRTVRLEKELRRLERAPWR